MKRDLYQTVTDKIIAELEAGTLPWSKGWRSGAMVPMNATTNCGALAYLDHSDRTKIIITVSGGCVQDVAGIPAGVIVEIRDYDGELNADDAAAPDSHACADVEGKFYEVATYSAEA